MVSTYNKNIILCVNVRQIYRMKFIFAFIFGIQFCYSQTNWSKFTPEDNSFEILTPGKMEKGIKHIMTDFGEQKIYTYLHKGSSESPECVYIINYVDYPEGTFPTDSTELIEDFFLESILEIKNSLGGNLVYQADQSTTYNSCKIYKINYNNGKAALKAKMFLVKDRFYSLQAFTTFEKSTIPELDKFLQSFKTLDN